MDYQPTTIESNERGWRDALVVVLLPLWILFLQIAWPLYFVRRSYSLRKHGFWVTREGRDSIEYQELCDGSVRRLTIGGELRVKGPRVVYIPTEAEWQQWQPAWAQGRREEIVEKVRRALGTKNYEFVSY